MDRHLIDAAVERAMGKDMEWGRDDCCLWVCDLIADATGADLAKPLRGYRSRIGAARRLKAFAGGGIVEAAVKLAATARLKPAAWPWSGELVGVVSDANGPALAIFHNGAWLGRTQRGVTALPPHAAVIAWELPKCRR